MMRMKKGFGLVAAGALIFGFAFAAQAQDAILRSRQAPVELAQGYGLPPADVGGGDIPRGRGGDDASLLLRIERLESQVRQMNGQLEQMQFENHRLEEQLRKFQQDVDFRLQENGGRAPKPVQKRSELQETPAPGQAAILDNDEAGSPATPNSTTTSQRARRGDAFDPAADPDAPGAPRAMGSMSGGGAPQINAGRNLPPSRPIAMDDNDPDAPLELSSSPSRSTRATPTLPDVGGGNPPAPATSTPRTPTGGTVIASLPPNSPQINPVKEEFDVALGYMRQKEYENAERSFSAFLQKNPKSRYSAEAIYYLGESYFLRGRQREAAEQYLKISTDYSNSSRAPDALLRLGQSLNALGAKEQACASFTEIGHKYPNASAGVKAAAEREAKRVQC
jgi:tol-pal system protein YbgF